MIGAEVGDCDPVSGSTVIAKLFVSVSCGTYSFKGIIHKFRPDYLVRLTNGRTLILEVKGQDDQQQQTKREFLSEWIRAVNGHGGFGDWAADVSRHPKDVLEILQKHNS